MKDSGKIFLHFFLKMCVLCITITKRVFLPFSFLFQETDCRIGSAFLTGGFCEIDHRGTERGYKYRQ